MFEIHNLSLKYGKKTLLHPTSLKFQEGKLYTIYRKSSLLNKIGLILIKVSKGDIAVKYYIYIYIYRIVKPRRYQKLRFRSL